MSTNVAKTIVEGETSIQRMRVLHLYSGNLFGGIERMLLTMEQCRGLCPDLEPFFGLCFKGRLQTELRQMGATVHCLGEAKFSRPWSILQARRALHRLLAREQFVAVVTHAAWSHAIFASTIRANSVPLAHWVHDALTGKHLWERLSRWMPPDLLLVNSQFTAATVPRVFPRAVPTVLNCPVLHVTASHSRNVVRTKLQTNENDIVFLQASRLEPWKGHVVLIEALGRLREIPNWTAWFAGGPQKKKEAEYLAELQRQAASLGIAERVRFLGQRNDIADLMAAADLFCQPNTGPEPFGIVFIEALLAGCPVVATQLGGALEVIDETCGTLVPPGDSRALGDALKSYMENTELRVRHSRAAPSRATGLCDPIQQLQKFAAHLRKLPSSVAFATALN